MSFEEAIGLVDLRAEILLMIWRSIAFTIASEERKMVRWRREFLSVQIAYIVDCQASSVSRRSSLLPWRDCMSWSVSFQHLCGTIWHRGAMEDQIEKLKLQSNSRWFLDSVPVEQRRQLLLTWRPQLIMRSLVGHLSCTKSHARKECLGILPENHTADDHGTWAEEPCRVR